jgi:23S rRNA A2030 N6-methylase RlmJ
MYNHCHKAGNRSDVWKHFWLCEILSLLTRDSHQQVSILDTHCGAGHFYLSESDDWIPGIGRFENDLPLLHTLGELVRPYLPALQYLGSWLLIASLMKHRSIPFQLHACDISDEVANIFDRTVQRFGHAGRCWHASVDGYEYATKGSPFDIVLLDPPYHPDAEKDWNSLRRTIRAISSSCATVAVWYPIYWPTKPQELIDSTGMVGHELLWAEFGDKPSQNPKGCGFAYKSNTQFSVDPIVQAAAAVAERLDGRYSCRISNK